MWRVPFDLTRRSRCAPFFLVPALFLAAPATLPGQDARPRPHCEAPFYWAVNVGTATISALVQGRSAKVPPVRALVAGVTGGSIIYGGQRMVGTGSPGLRFAGLQTVAVGASVTRNIGTGGSPLEELTFPVFPLYVRLHPLAGPGVDVRLSAVALGGIIHTALEFHTHPDWNESLVAGMPVFSVPVDRLGPCAEYDRFNRCIGGMVGHHVFGAVTFVTRSSTFTGRNVLTHELGHAAQDVRDAVLHAVPLSDAALGSVPFLRTLSHFVVLDLALPLDYASRVAGPPPVDHACRGLGSFYECETEAMMTHVD